MFLTSKQINEALAKFICAYEFRPNVLHRRLANTDTKFRILVNSNTCEYVEPNECQLVVRPENMRTVDELVFALKQAQDSHIDIHADAVQIVVSDRGEWAVTEASPNLYSPLLHKVISVTPLQSPIFIEENL